jgi:SAM-dependent methyltransferase
MNSANTDDIWASGVAYDSYMGRWSRPVAAEFLAWLEVPSGGRWLDVGCGTGALSQTILEITSPRAVRGIDPSVAFIEYARKHINDRRAQFDLGDAQALPYAKAEFEAVVSGLVLNFVPDPATAVMEMARVTLPSGTVAAYVWDYAGEMQMLRHFWDAAVALDPAASGLDEGRRFPLCKPTHLVEISQRAGLRDVVIRSIDAPAHFRDFDEYWAPFQGRQGPAPDYVASLSEERRAVLRERVRASMPIAPDGSFDLTARAWAVRGTM